MALFTAAIVIHLVCIGTAARCYHHRNDHFNLHSGKFGSHVADFQSILNHFFLLQEIFRYGIYRILRETENGLQLVSDNSRIVENKHILAYVSGLGFGIMSGAFALVNILADAVRKNVENVSVIEIFSLRLCFIFVSQKYPGGSSHSWTIRWPSVLFIDEFGTSIVHDSVAYILECDLFQCSRCTITFWHRVRCR